MYLVSALLVSFVIALFLAAALRLSMGSLKMNDENGQRALYAAESGLRYIQARLASDHSWEGNEGLAVTTSDLVVYEDRGNIVGILRTPAGDFAQFRARFNYQDDSQGNADGRSDPALYSIDHPYVSVKNILGGSPRFVPRADGPGWSVTPASPTPYEVPAGAACVIVEGRYGPGLGSLSSSNLNPTVNGQVSTRIVEAYLETTAPPGADAAAMSAGDMKFGVESGQAVALNAKDSGQVSRLRSRADIEVDGGASPNLVSSNGETYTQDGTVQADASSDIQVFMEDPSKGFYSLEWGEVKKATSSDSTLAAGTYVVWDDGSLHYYDMSYSQYVTFIEANPGNGGTPVSSSDLPAGMTLDTSNPNKPKLTISQNILVDGSSASTDELTIIPRKGAQENPPDAPDDSDLDAAVTSVANSLPSGVSDGGFNKTEWSMPLVGPAPSPDKVQVSTGSLDFELHVHSDGRVHLENAYMGSGILTPSQFQATLTDPSIPLTKQAEILTLLAAVGGSGSGSMRELEVGANPANLRADDVEILFDPPEGESAILSSEGSVRLGAKLTGRGGSITSAGDIRIVGDGDTSLSASVKDGLTLYAKGNVVMSGLKEVPVGSNNWEYKDVNLKGVVYAWGDIDIKLGHDDPSVSKHGDFFLQGSIVAYGGDPAGAPGAGGNGSISVDANSVEFKYDPVYLTQLALSPPTRALKQTLYTTH